MPGLLDTVMGYKKNAIAGFVRESAQEQQRETANKQIDDAQSAQEMQMGIGAAGAVAAIIAACIIM